MINPHVTIVMLNWNGAEDTIACLESLLSVDYNNMDLILIDNGSTDDSPDKIKLYLDDVFSRYVKTSYLQFPCNAGFAIGSNFGMKYALEISHPDYILLLNNDTLFPDPDFLIKMVSLADAHHAGMAQCLMLREGDHETIDTTGHVIVDGIVDDRGNNLHNTGQYTDQRGLVGCSGACALYSIKMIEDIGMLDETYTAGYDDSEYSWRAFNRGWVTVYCPNAVIYHKREASTKRRDVIDLGYKMQIQMNMYLPCKKHGSLGDKARFIARMVYLFSINRVARIIGKNHVDGIIFLKLAWKMLF